MLAHTRLVLSWTRTLLIALALASSVGAQVLETTPLRTGQARRSYRRVVTTLTNARLDVDWRRVPLRSAVAELRSRLRLPLLVERDLGEASEEVLGLQLESATGLALVRLIQERTGVVFLHDRGVLRVTTRERALRASAELRIIDIRALLYVPADFPAPPIDIPIGRPTEPEPPAPKEPRDPQEVVDLVRMATGGDAAWEFEAVKLEARGGLLIVRHTPRKQREVRRFLARLRAVW